MDAAIYHSGRNSIFSVRGGYIFEFSLSLSQLATSKFVNPCFSKSCLAYDSSNDKLWVGTMGDWAAGRTGDPGSGGSLSKTNAGIYRINPSTLALELSFYPNDITWGQLDTPGPVYHMPSSSPFRNPPTLFDPASGFYDLIYAGGKLWGSMFSGSAGGQNAYIISFNPPTPATSNLLTPVNSTLALIQCAYETFHTPAQVWFIQCDDLFNALNPISANADWSAAGSARFYNVASAPVPAGASGIVFSPVGGGFMYCAELTGQALIKYNMDGSINSTHAMAGAALGGQPMRLRFNSLDNLIYVPCPATNMVVAYSPASDTVSQIYTTGLDAPHDVVFAPGHKIAVQFGSVGLKELT